MNTPDRSPDTLAELDALRALAKVVADLDEIVDADWWIDEIRPMVMALWESQP